MLTRQEKEEQVAELKDKFERATSVFVADYKGLGVAQIESLRGGLRKAEASESEFRVAKNSVLRLASAGEERWFRVGPSWFAKHRFPTANP